jgi:hypothetical protein
MPDAPGVRSVVEDDNIAWPESWDKELLDVVMKLSPLIGPSKTQGVSMQAQRKAARNVMVFQCPYGNARRQPTQSPAPDRNHVGFRPCLVDDDKALGVEPSLIWS